ncbi:MAG: multiple sugar transport system substrate-binding protein [Phycisphaerales bacterium]
MTAIGAAGLGYILDPFGSRRREIPKGRTVVRYWEKWTGQEGLAVRKIVDAFNASQSDVWVDYLTIAQIDMKAMLAIAGGDPPDVLGLWSYTLPAFIESGAFLPLDELARASGIREADYIPNVWTMLTHGGRMWAGVNTASSVALYYDKQAFREVGLDPESPPRTVAELDEAADRLTKYNDDGSIERAGFIHKEPGWFPALWPSVFGGDLFDEANNIVTADRAENIEAMRWVQSYPEKLGQGPVQSFVSGNGGYNSPQNAFLSGRVAMVVQGPWLVNTINAFKPGLDYGVCAIPVESGVLDPANGLTQIECDALVIPKGCKNPEAAWAFIAFTQRAEIQEMLAIDHAKPSPMASVSTGFNAAHPNRYVQRHAELMGSNQAVIWPRTSVWPFYADEMRKVVDKVWADPGLDPAAAMGEVQRRVEREHAIQQNRLEQQGWGEWASGPKASTKAGDS